MGLGGIAGDWLDAVDGRTAVRLGGAGVGGLLRRGWRQRCDGGERSRHCEIGVHEDPGWLSFVSRLERMIYYRKVAVR